MNLKLSPPLVIIGFSFIVAQLKEGITHFQQCWQRSVCVCVYCANNKIL